MLEATRKFIDFEVKNIQVGRWRCTGFTGVRSEGGDESHGD